MSEIQINIATNNRTLTIIAPVLNSLNSSKLADLLDKLPYLKVFERNFKEGNAEIKCHIIRGIYSIEKLHEDLSYMSHLIL